MNRNVKIKAGIIAAVILVCLYGIIGIPKSKDELVANWHKNIHLGLDLSGGTQLVMQVQLQDAFKAFADNTIERLRLELQKDGISTSGDLTRNDPMTLEDADKIEIDVKGIPSDKSSAFRGIVNNQFGDWVATALNSSDYKLTMKATEALKLKQDTMTQTMATIERKINALGLAESSVQPTGRSDAEAELLVQLPGVDDSAHVKQLLQTQAVLEWDEVKDGPFNSREEALTKHGGILPLNTKLVPTAVRGGQQEWYLVSRSAIVYGTDIRDASAAQGELNRWETNFVLTQ
jgi:preprotein translocase subunit SecD